MPEVPNPLVIFLQIVAKVHSTVGGGTFLLHCNLTTQIDGVPSDDEPLNLGIKVSQDLFDTVSLDDVLALPLDPHIQRPSLAGNN